MNTKEQSKAEAMEIIKQLGGGRFVAMTGASLFVYDHEKRANVSFKFKGSRISNHVKIELNALDLYDVTFYKITKTDFKIVSERSGLYNDMLESHFKEITGLNTRLF